MLYTWKELLPDQYNRYSRGEQIGELHLASSNNSFNGSNVGIKMLKVKRFWAKSYPIFLLFRFITGLR